MPDEKPEYGLKEQIGGGRDVMGHYEANLFCCSPRGREIASALVSRLTLPTRIAISVLHRAFLGDDDFRFVVDACVGELAFIRSRFRAESGIVSKKKIIGGSLPKSR